MVECPSAACALVRTNLRGNLLGVQNKNGTIWEVGGGGWLRVTKSQLDVTLGFFEADGDSA